MVGDWKRGVRFRPRSTPLDPSRVVQFKWFEAEGSSGTDSDFDSVNLQCPLIQNKLLTSFLCPSSMSRNFLGIRTVGDNHGEQKRNQYRNC